MKFTKSAVLGAIVGALVFASAPSMAVPPPPPPGMVLAPGMTWCPRCGGHGRVPSGFLGWNDKRCPECKGYRMVRMLPPPPPPPPPVHHHHAKPVPSPHHHAKPAPHPMPPARPAPRGVHGHR